MILGDFHLRFSNRRGEGGGGWRLRQGAEMLFATAGGGRTLYNHYHTYWAIADFASAGQYAAIRDAADLPPAPSIILPSAARHAHYIAAISDAAYSPAKSERLLAPAKMPGDDGRDRMADWLPAPITSEYTTQTSLHTRDCQQEEIGTLGLFTEKGTRFIAIRSPDMR